MITQKDLNGKRVVCKACGCAPESNSFPRLWVGGIGFRFGCKRCGSWVVAEELKRMPQTVNDYQMQVLRLHENAAQEWFINFGELVDALPEYDPRDEYVLMGEW